ncbi:hypothetical protein GGI20_003516, partial [Coemansia sp. BCRC 34301]
MKLLVSSSVWAFLTTAVIATADLNGPGVPNAGRPPRQDDYIIKTTSTCNQPPPVYTTRNPRDYYTTAPPVYNTRTPTPVYPTLTPTPVYPTYPTRTPTPVYPTYPTRTPTP